MNTNPTTEELVRSVAMWIDEIRPTLDPRNAFLARVAANALATVGRELTLGPVAEAEAIAGMAKVLGHAGGFVDLNSELCARLRAGEFTIETPGLLAVLTSIAKNQIAIDQPNYRPEGTPAP